MTKIPDVYMVYGGSFYYPEGGTNDLIGTFNTLEEAVRSLFLISEDYERYHSREYVKEWSEILKISVKDQKIVQEVIDPHSLKLYKQLEEEAAEAYYKRLEAGGIELGSGLQAFWFQKS